MDINLGAGNGNLNTSAAVIAAEQNINIVSAGMNNQQGSISGRDITIKTAELNNQQGSIIGYESLVSDSQSLNNESGQLESANMLSINTNGKAFNNQNGRVSGQTIDVKSGDINNLNGMIYAWDKASLSGAEINNENGSIRGESSTDINADTFSNKYGTVVGQDVSITASTIDNTMGVVAAGSSLTLKADEINNQSGDLNGDVITLTSDVLKNESGTVAANTKLNMSVKDSQNDNGLISVGGVDINYDGTSAPVIDVSDDSAFWAWNASVNNVYMQILSSFPKISALPEVMTYMYKILASGNEINSEMIKQLALLSWGYGYTEENISNISKIADIMTTTWNNPPEAQGGASQPDNGDTLVPDSDDQSASDIADASLPSVDLTDSNDFWTWNASVGGSGFYQQLVNAGIPGITSGVMHDVLNYMYQVLVSGGEISDATVKQLAANIWGLASNQDRLDELSTIAATMAASLNQN